MASIRYPAIDEDAVSAMARLFGAEVAVERYSPDGTPVYRIEPGGRADGVRLILWPSLRRVDVTSSGKNAWVLKDVGEVEVIPGVEVIFHPASGRGYLFVAVNGAVNMVMG